MNRFYKIGKCDWCRRLQQRVFLTTFESETSKLMCDRCKDFIEHQRLIRDGISYAVDLWDETTVNTSQTSEVDTRFNTSMKSDEFLIKQSSNGKVKLFGYHSEQKFVVRSENEFSLDIEKVRKWEYTKLSPASHRFNLESARIGG